MNNEQQQSIAYNKAILNLRHGFVKKSHDLKLDLMKIRHKYTVQGINIRDKVAEKRHKERLEIISQT